MIEVVRSIPDEPQALFLLLALFILTWKGQSS